MGAPAGVRNDSAGSTINISDTDSGNQSCWSSNPASPRFVEDRDGEDVITTRFKIHAVNLAFSKIYYQSVDVVGCDDDAGKNGYLSNRSGEVLTKICHRIRRHGGGTSGGRPDPFSVGTSIGSKIEHNDMADAYSEQGA